MFSINWIFLIFWILVGGCMSVFLAPFVVNAVAGKQMTIESKLYTGVITTVASYMMSMFFGMFYVWLIIANTVLWFLLPMWWKIDGEDKNKVLIFYIGANLVGQLAIYFLFTLIQLGA